MNKLAVHDTFREGNQDSNTQLSITGIGHSNFLLAEDYFLTLLL